MSAPVAVRTARVQWWVLTSRTLRPAARNGEFLTALLAPVVFTVGFYIPLEKVISLFGNGVDNYGQFLMPLIALQAIAFTAISAAFLAATDAVDGINKRFASMPITPAVPLGSRVASGFVKCVVSLLSALACGHVIGFRFGGSGASTAGFCALTLLIGLVLILGADVIGTMSSSPEATTQTLVLPQLILGMLSSGFAPVEQFPDWIQPFVRNQPVSQFAAALRSLADGSADAVIPALLWIGGLALVLIPVSLRLNTRRP